MTSDYTYVRMGEIKVTRSEVLKVCASTCVGVAAKNPSGWYAVGHATMPEYARGVYEREQKRLGLNPDTVITPTQAIDAVISELTDDCSIEDLEFVLFGGRSDHGIGLGNSQEAIEYIERAGCENLQSYMFHPADFVATFYPDHFTLKILNSLDNVPQTEARFEW